MSAGRSVRTNRAIGAISISTPGASYEMAGSSIPAPARAKTWRWPLQLRTKETTNRCIPAHAAIASTSLDDTSRLREFLGNEYGTVIRFSNKDALSSSFAAVDKEADARQGCCGTVASSP